MRRMQLIEIEDQSWCPRGIRDGLTDFLQAFLGTLSIYNPILPRLTAALAKTGTNRVIDLCSGGGGPWLGMLAKLQEGRETPVEITLTDLYPNLKAFERTGDRSGGCIQYEAEPVDASHVPERLKGFRILFSSFHHFEPDQARAILRDAVARRQGIGIFEFTQRSVLGLAGMLLSPLASMALMPTIRPFRLSRLLWTYLLPVVPLAGFFDGVVSCLRTYTPAELRGFVEELGVAGYVWDIGEERVPTMVTPITYLVGYPEDGS